MSLAQASGKTIASAVPWKSSTTSRAYSLPVFLQICRFTPVTTAADASPGARSTRPAWRWCGCRTARPPSRNGSSGWPEMKKPRISFSLTSRSASVQGGMSGRRRCAAARRAVVGCSPNSETWPASFSCCSSCASPARRRAPRRAAAGGRRGRRARRPRSAPRARACCRAAGRSARTKSASDVNGASCARGEDRLDGAPADVPDGAEAEADPLVADHRELEARLVHVRRQHLEVRARAPR